DIHELRSFLGMTNTLLHFVPMYASLVASFTDLLRGSLGKADSLPWTPTLIAEFDTLKKTLSSSLVTLHLFDPKKPVYLYTDWSQKAIGGWIGQEVQGKIQPIAYESRKLRPAERNYSPYDGELLALIHCLRIFQPYIHGQKVILRMDQKVLKWLLDQRTLS